MDASNCPKKVFVDAHVFGGEIQGNRTAIKEIYSRVIQICPSIHFVFDAQDVDGLRGGSVPRIICAHGHIGKNVSFGPRW